MIPFVSPLGVRLEGVPALDPDSVTPGVAGFFAMFVVSALVVLLAIDMTRRIRRTRYRSEVSERLDAEEALARADQDELQRVQRDDPPRAERGDPRL